MRLRRDTQWLRRTVDQTGKVILPPEIALYPDVPESAVRFVHVVFPETDEVVVAVGPVPEFDANWDDPNAIATYFAALRARGGLVGVDDAGALPSDIANGRTWQWPEPPGGQPIKFHIRASQWISAMAVSGLSKVSIIVEYVEE